MSAAPSWFVDVLHEVIYADGEDGHLAVKAISAMVDARSPSDPAILEAWARGSGQAQIACRLGTSRHHVCRRMTAMRRRLGDGALRRLRGRLAVAEALKAFDFRQGRGLPDVLLAVERLAELSPVELRVLAALARMLPAHEAWEAIGISDVWYYAVRAKLMARFHIVRPRRGKVPISGCLRTAS